MKILFIGILLAPLSLIIYYFGINPSLSYDDWSWFGRSGSLVVVYGAMITFLDISKVIQENEYILFHSAKIKLKADHLRTEPQKDMLRKEVEFERQIYPHIERDIKKGIIFCFRITEAFSLIVGTIIWGYGDKINVLLI
jgi:hypothetical protein